MGFLDLPLPQFVTLDLPPLVTAIFACLTCALLGNFLVLRRLSLMGDAISHAVLPGIVIAFLVSGSRATLPVFLGAAAAGIGSALLIEVVRRLGRVETGAAMGVVFSIFFALGVILMEQAAARSVDLDADCLLHGQLENIFWPVQGSFRTAFSFAALQHIPAELVTSLLVMLVILLLLKIFFKELVLTSFDPALATALGFQAPLVHYGLMIAVAIAVVASFKVVGSILVIAMLVCPAATARLLTDRIQRQIGLSVLFALITAIGGYFAGAFLPIALGATNSVNIAGAMSMMAGCLLLLSVFFAPRYGVLARLMRRTLAALRISEEDILGLLYRLEEMKRAGDEVHFSRADVLRITGSGWKARLAYFLAKHSGKLSEQGNLPILNASGRELAQSLVRTHRLWEVFLVNELGLRPDHVHRPAEELEHFGKEAALASHLAAGAVSTAEDPHGKPIPGTRDAE